MATRTVVCPECGAEVPYGRLSCVACGTLLASVAGGTRRAAGSAAGGPGPAQAADSGRASPGRGTDDATAGSTEAGDGERPMPSVLSEWTGPVPPARVDPVAITPAAPVGAVPRPRWVRDDRTSPADDPEAPDE